MAPASVAASGSREDSVNADPRRNEPESRRGARSRQRWLPERDVPGDPAAPHATSREDRGEEAVESLGGGGGLWPRLREVRLTTPRKTQPRLPPRQEMARRRAAALACLSPQPAAYPTD